MSATDALTQPFPTEAAPEPEVVEKATVVLFRLNDQEYRVPAKPKAVLTLRFLDKIRTDGAEVAVAHLLPDLLGEETWSQLLAEEDLEPEHLSAIFQAVKRLLMGTVDLESFSGGR